MENKISKTLVDTLIDLQLEDAPLLVKKGILGDKCGSCNQVLNSNQQNNPTPGYMINLPAQSTKQINQNNDENIRYKLRKIQDNSYKYGTGSYSRVLTNSNPALLSEDLNLKTSNGKHFINNSVHLPDINNIGISSKKMMEETQQRRKEWSQNRDENKDMSIGNRLTDEFDKKIVKADNLTKASQKSYDNIEKKK